MILTRTAVEFDAWLLKAKRGETVCYHEGCLASDRVNKRVGEVARAALDAAARGLVSLTQRRVGENHSEYLAQATRPGVRA